MSIRKADVVAIACAVAATAGCAAQAQDSSRAYPGRNRTETPLGLTVDALVVRHGELRMSATMDDGSPDVAVLLAPPCEPTEIGHGIATRSGFVWSLGVTDLARALECQIVVKVTVENERGSLVRKSASVPVSSLLVTTTERDDVQVVSLETSGATSKLTFRTSERVRRLHVGNVLIGADDEDDEDDDDAPFRSSFAVDNDVLARAILSRRRLVVAGVELATIAAVGQAALDLADDAAPEDAREAVPEGDEG